MLRKGKEIISTKINLSDMETIMQEAKTSVLEELLKTKSDNQPQIYLPLVEEIITKKFNKTESSLTFWKKIFSNSISRHKKFFLKFKSEIFKNLEDKLKMLPQIDIEEFLDQLFCLIFQIIESENISILHDDLTDQYPALKYQQIQNDDTWIEAKDVFTFPDTECDNDIDENCLQLFKDWNLDVEKKYQNKILESNINTSERSSLNQKNSSESLPKLDEKHNAVSTELSENNIYEQVLLSNDTKSENLKVMGENCTEEDSKCQTSENASLEINDFDTKPKELLCRTNPKNSYDECNKSLEKIDCEIIKNGEDSKSNKNSDKVPNQDEKLMDIKIFNTSISENLNAVTENDTITQPAQNSLKLLQEISIESRSDEKKSSKSHDTYILPRHEIQRSIAYVLDLHDDVRTVEFNPAALGLDVIINTINYPKSYKTKSIKSNSTYTLSPRKNYDKLRSISVPGNLKFRPYNKQRTSVRIRKVLDRHRILQKSQKEEYIAKLKTKEARCEKILAEREYWRKKNIERRTTEQKLRKERRESKRQASIQQLIAKVETKYKMNIN